MNPGELALKTKDYSEEVGSGGSGPVEIRSTYWDQAVKGLFINKLHLNTNFLDVQAVSSYRITSN